MVRLQVEALSRGSAKKTVQVMVLSGRCRKARVLQPENTHPRIECIMIFVKERKRLNGPAIKSLPNFVAALCWCTMHKLDILYCCDNALLLASHLPLVHGDLSVSGSFPR